MTTQDTTSTATEAKAGTVIATKAVLVSLNIRTWDPNTLDKRVSQVVADDNLVTDQRLCRLRKSLLAKNPVLDKLYAIVRAARTFHYDNTHTWMHDGPRVLMTINYEPYMQRMRQANAEFEACVLEFLDQFEDLKEQSRNVLGKLFNENDYPLPATLKTNYGFKVSVQPLPASSELLDLGLEGAEAAELRAKLEADMSETFNAANRRMWEDLHMRLSKLVTKLVDEKAYVRQETIAGVQDLVALLPRLNITGDVQLEALSERLRASLAGITAESVKHNPDVRHRAAEETKTIFDAMAAFMNPSIETEAAAKAA